VIPGQDLACEVSFLETFRKARFSFQIQLKWWKPPLFTKG
jgi:hypothetical protein